MLFEYSDFSVLPEKTQSAFKSALKISKFIQMLVDIIIVICAQVGENKGRPCEGGGQLKKKERESRKGEKEKLLRVSHNLFNTTLRPLVAGLEYQGEILKKMI